LDMIALFALLAAVAISLLVTRIATMALTLTGLSRESARFQARSAFTGVGFTTSESEQVVNHPVRRRILMVLMLIGNAGIITVIATLVITFTQGGNEGAWLLRVGVAALAFTGIWFLTWNRWVDRRLSAVIAWALRKWARVDARDYAALLRLAHGYSVTELAVQEHDWLSDKTLIEADVSSEGVLVLGIHRADGTFIGAPRGSSRIKAGDTLTIYGREESLAELDRRGRGRRGDQAHMRAIRSQKKVEEDETKADEEATVE
jgi:hypothetical protein